ncbi:MAG TPA: type IX secretion system sortase PorU, partial [Flavobacteriaceae bacterium]|nr:type IX secretion system sortase PorU [Flavobacteriaceae bacterium]
PTIQGFSNYNKLPLFITVTCEFARFDNPLRKTAGEYLLTNSNGGASALISTTRSIYISVGQAINAELTEPLLNFNNTNYSISETLAQVKNKFSTNQRFFIYYFGDPAMHLAIPKPKVELTKMNGKLITQSLDTIKALSKINFEGEIKTENGALLNNFNGEVNITVFDKAIEKTTLDNDNKGTIMPFKTVESKIFTGRATVKNGTFKFEFVAPKDLKIAYGKGKLSLYASNNEIEKAGYNKEIIIGGLNEKALEDNIGPTISMYLNDLNFIDGGQTNSSPNLIVVLKDENGINTSLTAVDHDIVAIIDNDQSNPIILNEFFTTELDDFTKGKITYPLKDLSPGAHTITLKAWDTYNNSSETTLNFIIVNDTDLEITKVLNYPNPFINHTQFWFNHNKPNTILQVQVQIFTVSGKLVKTINENVTTSGNTSKSITWNGLDDFGSKIGKGVYIYTLKVKDLQGNTGVEKVEKLVILQ